MQENNLQSIDKTARSSEDTTDISHQHRDDKENNLLLLKRSLGLTPGGKTYNLYLYLYDDQ